MKQQVIFLTQKSDLLFIILALIINKIKASVQFLLPLLYVRTI